MEKYIILLETENGTVSVRSPHDTLTRTIEYAERLQSEREDARDYDVISGSAHSDLWEKSI